MASSAFFFSTWMRASLERVSFFSIASAWRACSILARERPSSMLDSMISWREKISSSLGWNLRVFSSSISAMSALASRLSSAVPASTCSRDSLAPAAARSASPSLSWRSKSVGSKRSTTSPAATREPSGAIQAIFIGRGRPRGGGGVIGVALTALRFPSAVMRRTNFSTTTVVVGTEGGPPPPPRATPQAIAPPARASSAAATAIRFTARPRG